MAYTGVLCCYGNDLIVGPATIYHAHYANHARGNKAKRYHGNLGEHDDVERIEVFAQRLWNETVIEGKYIEA